MPTDSPACGLTLKGSLLGALLCFVGCVRNRILQASIRHRLFRCDPSPSHLLVGSLQESLALSRHGKFASAKFACHGDS